MKDILSGTIQLIPPEDFDPEKFEQETNAVKKQMEEKRQERLATNADLVEPPVSDDNPSRESSVRPSANIENSTIFIYKAFKDI